MEQCMASEQTRVRGANQLQSGHAAGRLPDNQLKDMPQLISKPHLVMYAARGWHTGQDSTRDVWQAHRVQSLHQSIHSFSQHLAETWRL